MNEAKSQVHEAPFYYVHAESITLQRTDDQPIQWTSATDFVADDPNLQFKLAAYIKKELHEPWTVKEKIITLERAKEIVKKGSHLVIIGELLGITEVCIMMKYE